MKAIPTLENLEPISISNSNSDTAWKFTVGDREQRPVLYTY